MTGKARALAGTLGRVLLALERLEPALNHAVLPFLAGALDWVGMGEIHVPVSLADPFEHLLIGNKTGFPSEDLPFLAPFMSVAIGTAAGATAEGSGESDRRRFADHADVG